MLALADQQGLYLLEFVARRGLVNEILKLRKRIGSFIVPGDNPILDEIGVELEKYFKGEDLNFKTPIVMTGSPFEKKVWNILRTIPAGETRSYGWMAQQLEKPGASRAVGQANGRNQLAIIIPCHRVIRSDGSLSGYGGGVWRKRWLLDHEQNNRQTNYSYYSI